MLFDKLKVREQLTKDNIYELLTDFGGEPEYTSFGLLSSTICHNFPGEGSRKLYWYENTGLFRCYTGCAEPTFDVFDLTAKVLRIQKGIETDLNDCVRFVAARFGISGEVFTFQGEESFDWKILENYDRIDNIESKDYHITLKEYDSAILDRLNYSVRLAPWLREGISQRVLDQARIGFYPGGGQITIPHYDAEGRFVGLRGRALAQEDADLYGKYRPVIINGKLYNHPLGMNLYNLNFSKENIRRSKVAIVFESEKSTLQFRSYFGDEADITVACCGSNLSAYQVQFLLDLGATEIIVAFDRQFQELNDDEFVHLTNNLTKIDARYKNYVNISFIFDKQKITDYKDSPTDKGPDTFLYLLNNRIRL